MAQSVKPVDAGVSVGQVFQGKYRVEAILGHGGMGVVAECTHLALNERVAIKMLRQDVLADQDAVSRFIREAQAAVKLKSEYVARVSDVGTFENGTPYMVMEYLEGHDLGELLKQRGVLPAQWTVELMLQTAEALAEAHSLGIVHRDVKPTNLFVTWRPDGTPLIKVLDFGISKSPMGTDMHLTQTQSLLGTPAYMSPEQMRSARLVDTRTDIWSLGTVFYEVLEGRRPFEAESFSEMCVKVAVDPPAPMVNTPPGLQQVILRSLAKSPEHRYPSMAELARDLVPYAADPHGAQMLVERMARMLSRSKFDWEGGSTGVGRQAVPSSVRDIGSGPVRPGSQPLSPQWGLGSDPAGVAWQAKSDPSLRPWHSNTPQPRGDASQPFARPLPNDQSQPFARPISDEHSAGYAGATLQERKKSRAWIVVLGLLLVAAGAIAFGVMKAQEQQEEPTNAELSAPTDPTPTPPAPTPTPTPPTPSPVVAPEPTDTKAAATTPEVKPDVAPAAEVKTGDTAKTGDTTRTGAVAGKGKGKGKGKGTKAGGTTAKAVPDKQTTTTTTKAAGSAAEVKSEPPKVENTGKPCDPFGSMHGCNKTQ